MRLFKSLADITPSAQGAVVAIGNFDGVHLGHQAVLRNVMAKAKELGCPATVMSFEPQPQELFAGDNAPARLTRFRDKYLRLKEQGFP